MRTNRTDLPIELRRVSSGTSRTMGAEVSYLCADGKDRRCTGLISPGGRVAVLCGCDCGCNDRARKAVLG